MVRFRLDSIAELAGQLKFTPQDARLAQLAAAETLLLELDPAKAYPLDYLIYRITGYHPKAVTPDLLTGLALQHDLGLLVEQVSLTLELHREKLHEPVLLIDDLIERFEVTSKTIQRWRRRGLPARSIVCTDGKRRVGFLLSNVERFIASQNSSPQDGDSYSPLDEQQRQQILSHARRLAGPCRCDEQEIALRIGRRLNRSPLAVLHTLRKHDRENPRDALLPLARPELSAAELAAIRQGHAAGASLLDLARELGRPRSTIYRALLDQRLARLSKKRIRFIDDALYHQDDPAEAETIINAIAADGALEETPSAEQSRLPRDVPADLQYLYRVPLLSASRERALFLKFNFHKYQFVSARRRLEEPLFRSADLGILESHLAKAERAKQAIVLANQRLVVSVARRHLRPGLNLGELISDGNITLMRAVEGFDIHKGHRFSTYATLALMKGFARSVPRMLVQSRRARGLDELLEQVPDPHLDRALEQCLQREDLRQAMSRLDERERGVLAAHFGLGLEIADAGPESSAAPATYEQVGRRLGLSRQRVRQIERLALNKLRAAFADAE